MNRAVILLCLGLLGLYSLTLFAILLFAAEPSLGHWAAVLGLCLVTDVYKRWLERRL